MINSHSYMNSILRVPLRLPPDQTARLLDLQTAFALACNALAPVVQQTRVWNRVALHHLAYRMLRTRFPEMGSQMICNVIYSVSRTSRTVFQHPASPFNLARLGNKPLPLLRFTENSPVYFDRHTLSLKDGFLSIFTLEGRMRFKLRLKPVEEHRFHSQKLSEIVLTRRKDATFELVFQFSASQGITAPVPDFKPAASVKSLPAYVKIEETE